MALIVFPKELHHVTAEFQGIIQSRLSTKVIKNVPKFLLDSLLADVPYASRETQRKQIVGGGGV